MVTESPHEHISEHYDKGRKVLFARSCQGVLPRIFVV